MLPGSILFAASTFSISFVVMFAASITAGLGTICRCLYINPVISAMATSGSCSIRLLTTLSANSDSSRNFCSSVGSCGISLLSVRFK